MRFDDPAAAVVVVVMVVVVSVGDGNAGHGDGRCAGVEDEVYLQRVEGG